MCSATFEQLLAFGATFCGFSNLEQVLPFRAFFEQNIGLEHISSTKKVNDFVENLNSCEFLEGLSCYQPFEHITCHLTTFRRPNWPISCGYTCLLPKVTLWVIALGWDRFGFPSRFSPPVTLQIITQGQLLTWQYLAGNLIHHGDRKPRNIRLACGRSSASHTPIFASNCLKLNFKLFFLTDFSNYCEEQKIKLSVNVYIKIARNLGSNF